MASSSSGSLGFSDCTSDQLLAFSRISNDTYPRTMQEVFSAKQLFIGKNEEITISLEPNESLKLKEIVVLGKLYIQRKNSPTENPLKPLISADCVVVAGSLRLSCAKLDYKQFINFKDSEEFYQELAKTNALRLEILLSERSTKRKVKK